MLQVVRQIYNRHPAAPEFLLYSVAVGRRRANSRTRVVRHGVPRFPAVLGGWIGKPLNPSGSESDLFNFNDTAASRRWPGA